jgi:hypothetical protein
MSHYWSEYHEGSAFFHTAQLCLNGHVIGDRIDEFPEQSERFCSRCGAETISACQACKKQIRGGYEVPGVAAEGEYHPPTYCYNCQAAFPWTEKRLEAARLLATETEAFDDADRQQLNAALPDIVADTPMTPVASARFNRLMAKAGLATADIFRELLLDVASETARKLLWPREIG